MQSSMFHRLHNVSSRLVGQMAMLATHPPLEKRGVGRLRQQVWVVIAFNQQGMAIRQVSHNMLRAMPQIREDA